MDMKERLAGLSPEKRALFLQKLRERKMIESTGQARIEPRSNRGDVPLSHAQQSLWFLDQLEGASATYSIPSCMRLHGFPDVWALEWALHIIIERHEILRCRFSQRDGQAFQVIEARAEPLLAVLDLSALSPDDGKSSAQALAERELARPFELELGPLIRFCLIRLEQQKHILLLNMHHIISDGVSLGVFAEELTRLYRAALHGKEAGLAPLAIQYADFAQWQRSYLKGAVLDREVAWWRKTLAGTPDVLALPTDHRRPALMCTDGGECSFSLDRQTTSILEQLSQQVNASLFMLLQAVFADFLSRYCGGRNLAIGSPVSGRHRPELEPLIGFFVNMLVFHVDLAPSSGASELSVGALLCRVRETILAAWDHQDIPFERLVEKLVPQRDSGHNPIFQVAFVWQQALLGQLDLEGLRTSPLEVAHHVAKFDLTLEMDIQEGCLLGSLQYRRDLFERTTIEIMVGHLINLLRAYGGDQDGILQRPLSGLSMLGLHEQEQLLHSWNNTAVEHPRDCLVQDRFRQWASATPDAPALNYEGRAFSYAEIDGHANRLAHQLVACGVGAETQVVTHLDRSPELIVSLLAILKAGAVYVPTDPTHPAERLHYILKDSGAAVVLTQARYAEMLSFSGTVISVALDPLDQQQSEAQTKAPPLAWFSLQRPAYIIYTSGSTGRPKGVVVTHAGLMNLALCQSRVFSVDASSRVAQLAALSFDASVSEIFMAWVVGASLCLAPAERLLPGADLAAFCEEYGVTHLTITPSALHAMPSDSLQTVQTLITAGEACSPELVAAWSPGKRFFNAYGPTEASVCATITQPLSAHQPVTIGLPIDNVRIYVADACCRLVSAGVPGELLIASTGLARAYIGRPRLTAAAFIPNPFASEPGERLYRSGDLVRRCRETGALLFLGRIDHQVKLNGVRIELGEIEYLLRLHPRVRDCLVMLREETGRKRLVAYVLERDGDDEQSFAEFLARDLPQFMLPTAFVSLEQWPLTANGKLDRSALPAANAGFNRNAFVAASNDTERQLAAIWCEVLGVERVSIHDNFFGLGGDSILSIQVVSKARQAGLDLAVRDLFQHQTVAQLALNARTLGTSIIIARHEGSGPLTPIQEWFFLLPGPHHHFNQSIMMQAPYGLDTQILETALTYLIELHEALRYCFERTDSGTVQISAKRRTEFRALEIFDLSLLPDTDQGAELERQASRLQASLDPWNGELFRFAWFEMGHNRAGRLLLIIHHLVVDGISWRILIEDLLSLCAQLERGQTPQLPAVPTSFLHWAARLVPLAHSPAIIASVDSWCKLHQGIAAQPEWDPAKNTAAQSGQVRVSLGRDLTQNLLRNAASAYHTEINDLLLCALARALRSWKPERYAGPMLLGLEGHGRESLFPDLDLSRTLGWFTSLFPIRLDPPDEISDAIKTVKEQLRSLPHKGLSYGLLRYLNPEVGGRLAALPQPEVAFNYLGQFTEEKGDWSTAEGEQGDVFNSQWEHPFLLQVLAMCLDQDLEVTWIFGHSFYAEEEIETLANSFIAELSGLIHHCLDPKHGGYTPSDFPLVALSCQEVEQLEQRFPRMADIYPLAPLQEGLWFHTLFQPESTLYFEQARLSLEGELNVEAFREAWSQVLARHAALRAVPVALDGHRPLQVILSNMALPWQHLNWAHLDEAALSRKVEAFLREDRAQGFGEQLMLRMTLIETGPRNFLFVFSFHHMLMDGWSSPIVFNDFLEIYKALCKGTVAPLATIRDHREYIRWLEEQDRDQARNFWSNRLGDFEGHTPLPCISGTPKRGDTIDVFEIRLDQQRTAAQERFAREHHLTPNILALAAWALLLARYSGERDLVFGTTVSGRAIDLMGITEMVGLFINTLPVRVQLERETTVLQMLNCLQVESLERDAFAYAPLHEIGTWSGVPSGSPLFETMVVFENYPAGDAPPEQEQWPGKLSIADMSVAEHVHYPLSLAIGPDEAWLFKLAYDPCCYKRETIARLAGHLLNLQSALLESPSGRALSLPIFGQDERQQLIIEFNDTAMPAQEHRFIHQLFEAQAARFPDSTALIFAEQTMTYGELRERASRLAHFLSARVQPEMPVATLLQRSPEMVISFLAILQVGGVYVPIAPNSPPERYRYQLEDTACSLILTIQDLLEKVDLPPAVSPVLLDCASIWSEPSPSRSQLQLSVNHLAYVIYTSGSTGKPKGVAVPHQGLVNLALAQSHAFHVTAQSRVALVASPIFDASISEMIMTWPEAAALCLDPGERLMPGEALAAFCKDYRVTHITLTPTVLAAMPLDSLGSVTTLITAGEACLPELVSNWSPMRNMINAFGPTEATVCITMSDPLAPDRNLSIGGPIDNTRVYVVDSFFEPVPILVAGELLMSSPGLARGYHNRPGQTACAFVPDPFSSEAGSRLYRSGDLVRWFPDGTLDFLGRIDHQVKIRGFRIEPGEIEKGILGHKSVVDCCVILHGEGVHKQLAAVVVPETGEIVHGPTLRSFLGSAFPDYMVPGLFVVIDALPLSHSGKIDRVALKRCVSEYRVQLKKGTSETASPKSELQKQLIELWRKTLNVADPGIDDNFFDLGGHSLLMVGLQSRLKELVGPVPLVTLFQYPSIRSLSQYLNSSSVMAATPREAAPVRTERSLKPGTTDIAVIGYALRVPGASDGATFWHNLRDGVESVVDLSDEDHLAAGMTPQELADPHFVKRGAVLEGIDLFDANFFGISPGEAEIMDPQHRLFLECTWEALEHAGYDPEFYTDKIGLFAGVSMNGYRGTHLPHGHHSFSEYQIHMLNDRDFLPTRVAYKLNLKGPSINVQTGCSSSLTAIHMAARSIMSEDCSMALAGGVSVNVLQQFGYHFQPGMVQSADGHCRAFDAEASGTVGGSGVGVVLLKRLDGALEDGDYIHAVIKGSAINNDGSDKVGYTAPSVSGQEAVIREALNMAAIDCETVGYVEAHGTGTPLGDPIEITALTRAYKGRKMPCPIGSVKTNIGHLDAAAGVAGFLKVVLCLKHRELPPSLHFNKPNPNIDFEGSPFYVNSKRTPWRSSGPRRAGVSSFGIGGTNVHMIVEEAAEIAEPKAQRSQHLMVLSAKTESSLDRAAHRLATYLQDHPELDPAELAFTLQRGRALFSKRRFLCFTSAQQAAENLQRPGKVIHCDERQRRVAFLFPGQGSQHVNMGRGIAEPVFRAELDRCAEILIEPLGFDMRNVMYPEHQGELEFRRLQGTELAQPALFALCYALAKQWCSWGLNPCAAIGHSIGEYVAACLAGVFSLEDALTLVCHRGRLMSQMPVGSMLAVSLPEQELCEHLGTDCSLAAINGPSQCVVSGSVKAISELAARLAENRVEARPLHTDHAFHSAMTLPLMEPFSRLLATMSLKPPKLAFISNVTGTWITEAQATDPAYWAAHMREPVRFGQGLQTLLTDENLTLLEVGPGRTLTSLLRQHPAYKDSHASFSSLPHARSQEDQASFMLNSLGDLWSQGVAIDWEKLYPAKVRRVPLPTYAFARTSYWIKPPLLGRDPHEAASSSVPRIVKEPELSRWFHVPSWKRVPLAPVTASPQGHWLLLADPGGLALKLEQSLLAEGCKVTLVEAGSAWSNATQGVVVIRPGCREDYTRLVETLDVPPTSVLHMWNLGDSGNEEIGASDLDSNFYSLIYLVQALSTAFARSPIQILAAADGVHDVCGDESPRPERALILGPTQVIPQEYPLFSMRLIDMDRPQSGPLLERLKKQLWHEICLESAEPMIAWRNGHRWGRCFERLSLLAPLKADGDVSQLPTRLSRGGVYLITGGLGGMGLTLAQYLAESAGARLILTTRAPIPPRNQWQEILDSSATSDPLAQRLIKLRALEAQGAVIEVVQADVTDREAMQRGLALAVERLGAIKGIIHAAGLPGDGTIYLKTREMADAVLAPKLQGTLVLASLIDPSQLDFFVLCSSLSAILGGVGQVDYCAANAFLDSFAVKLQREGVFCQSINWDSWLDVGMAASPTDSHEDRDTRIGILPKEGCLAFQRILTCDHAQVLTSVIPLEQQHLLHQAHEQEGLDEPDKPSHPRPELNTVYAAPVNPTEIALTEIWQRLLGISPIGCNDDFFALGGDSLLATRLMFYLREAFSVDVPLQTILQAATPASQAKIVEAFLSADGKHKGTEFLDEVTVKPNLVAMREGSGAIPMFFVHPVGGHILCYRELVSALAPEQAFYAFFADGLEGEAQPLSSIETMAEKYIAQLESFRPEGPISLGGWSLGGVVAFEMARRLRQRGREIADLVLLDSYVGEALGRDLDENDLLVEFSADLGVLFDPVETRDLPVNELLDLLLEKMKALGKRDRDFDRTRLSHLYHVFKVHVDALTSYRPQPYEGDLALLHVEQHEPASIQIWQKLAKAGLITLEVPGDHLTMMSPPQVGFLADRLSAYLGSSRDNPIIA